MYVILRGCVTIYHNYGVVTDGSAEDSDVTVTSQQVPVSGEQLRQQLGAYVITLKGRTTEWVTSHVWYLSPFTVSVCF
jgi:hypothetical protein